MILLSIYRLFKSIYIIDKLKFNPKLYFGDGYKGRTIDAPFDKILVTCGAPFIPQDLLNQLRVGGVMVIPVGDGVIQEMKRIFKISENEYKTEDYGNFSFVPMLENTK